jgi:hypothetical protein
MVDRPRFQQQDAIRGIRAQPVGQNASGGTAADNDVIVIVNGVALFESCRRPQAA